jgi:hypothetical protein
MYLYPHIAADLHKYRTTEIQRAAEQTRLTTNNASIAPSYKLWDYATHLVKSMRQHPQPLTR